ncbi:MAG: putative toxin-antitoxin system toxin component, PIN family [Rhodocyclaceae bacterium]|nr:putative toxin-antitoxin system toxin component, PIN family [Rhodocyclaceae bacterium]
MKAEAADRVVVDTNVWISAALSTEGAPARLVLRVLKHGLPVFSPATFSELETRLWKPKFDRYLSMEQRQRLLHDLNGAAHWVSLPMESPSWSRDADDEKFIQTALSASAPWLVTGDRDLLDVPVLPGFTILTPAVALSLPEFCGVG